jgi:uncharacterized protein (DUF433 family)
MKHTDWTDCALIETVPDRMGGQPVIRDSRVRPEDLLINRDQGIEWLAHSHGIPVETIREIFAFHDARKVARRAVAHTP